MSKANESAFSAPGFYRIEIQGRLHKDWWSRLGAMQVSSYVPDNGIEVTILQVYVPDNGIEVTILQGVIRDQPELAGIMKTLYELHLTLRTVNYLGKLPSTN